MLITLAIGFQGRRHIACWPPAPAIEEALRYDRPVLVQTRQAITDTELGSVAIPIGALLEVVVPANRDPPLWNNPDSFDIFRNREAHWFFPHGQHLARVEMTRAIEAVLDHLPNLRLDPGRPAPKVRRIMMRAPEHIQVRFGS